MTDTPVPPPEPQPARQFGRFQLHSNVVDNMGLAGAIMAHLQFVPWDVRFDEKIQCFNCMGTSWLFRPCGPEEPAPYYRIDVKEVPSEQEPGMVELEVTVVEEVGLVEDHNIIQPLTKNSKVVGGKQ